MQAFNYSDTSGDILFINNGENIPKTHNTIKIQQSGVENNIEGSPPDNASERLSPFSPIGPRINASTMAALFRSNF